MTTSLFTISENAGVPKYQQIVQSVIDGIENKTLVKGDKVPSINEICMRFKLSRDTVLMAYNKLKTMGIIESVPGKGYYICSVNTSFKHKLFVLFDELNAFKENIYNSFIEGLKGKADVDLYFHHFNSKMFKNLIKENNGSYTSYVIMPAVLKNVAPVLSKLPANKVYILDQTSDELAKTYPAVYQNFSKDVFSALDSGSDLLSKYKKLILVFPGGKEPIGQKTGFVDFCEARNWDYEIISSLVDRDIASGEVYIMPNDNDLVSLLKKIKKSNLLIGENIGVISYNDTPLKEVVADGITTISTDFSQMGKSIADMILNNKKGLVENPSMLIRRSSL